MINTNFHVTMQSDTSKYNETKVKYIFPMQSNYNQTFRAAAIKAELLDEFAKSDKNRVRELPSFANINLMGKCNLKCFFCIGNELKQIAERVGKNINKVSQLDLHFKEWRNFLPFLEQTKNEGIEKLYLTGMDTDPAIYKYLLELVEYLKSMGFKVGIRTNGYYQTEDMDKVLSAFNDEISYSIHSFKPEINKKIIGTERMPDWEKIIPASGDNVRIATVVTRYNKDDVLDTIHELSKYPNVKYIQLRAICADINKEQYEEDIKAFEDLLQEIDSKFPKVDMFKGYPIYEIYGKRVSLWHALKVTINSNNYFTDGTITNSYFVTEGYSKSNLLK